MIVFSLSSKSTRAVWISKKEIRGREGGTFVGGDFKTGGRIALTFEVGEQSLQTSVSATPTIVIEVILHVMIIEI